MQPHFAERFVIERELGRGGMAVVYLARDTKHDRYVALKMLHPDMSAAIGRERLEREIRVTARLQHPHILPLHDSGEWGDALYYVMPFVDGESLRVRLNRERQLPDWRCHAGSRRSRRSARSHAHRARRDPPRREAREHSARRPARDRRRLWHRASRFTLARRAIDSRGHFTRHSGVHGARADRRQMETMDPRATSSASVVCCSRCCGPAAVDRRERDPAMLAHRRRSAPAPRCGV